MKSPYRIVLLLIVVITTSAICSTPLRVMSYNLLNYPGTDSDIRNPYFRRVLMSARPDVLVTLEVQDQSGVTNFENNVLNYYPGGVYAAAPFHYGPDTNCELFYDSTRVSLISEAFISTDLRDIGEYIIQPKWSASRMRIYAVHLKASNTTSDQNQRQVEATTLRTYLNQLPIGSNFIIAGDFNTYSSTDPGYKVFVDSTGNNVGRVKDPITGMTGTWNYGPYAPYHTQSPRVRSFGGGSTGGMDDRFDMILPSYALFNNGNIILSSYKAYGNDGHHFNDSINKLPNTAVPDSVANGLHYASDHLPVLCEFTFPDTVAAVYASVSVHQGWNLVSLPVTVYNSNKLVVFPTAISNAYYYPGTGQYAYDVSLHNKVGYWIKFDSAETFTLYGKPHPADTVNVIAGWNLIGGTGADVPVSNIITQPAGILSSSFYGFEKRYFPLDTLNSTKAYFIKVNADGKIILQP